MDKFNKTLKSRRKNQFKTKKGGFWGKPKLTDELKIQITETINHVITTLLLIWLGKGSDISNANNFMHRITGELVDISTISTMYDKFTDNYLKSTREDIHQIYKKIYIRSISNIITNYTYDLERNPQTYDLIKEVRRNINNEIYNIFSNATNDRLYGTITINIHEYFHYFDNAPAIEKFSIGNKQVDLNKIKLNKVGKNIPYETIKTFVEKITYNLFPAMLNADLNQEIFQYIKLVNENLIHNTNLLITNPELNDYTLKYNSRMTGGSKYMPESDWKEMENYVYKTCYIEFNKCIAKLSVRPIITKYIDSYTQNTQQMLNAGLFKLRELSYMQLDPIIVTKIMNILVPGSSSKELLTENHIATITTIAQTKAYMRIFTKDNNIKPDLRDMSYLELIEIAKSEITRAINYCISNKLITRKDHKIVTNESLDTISEITKNRIMKSAIDSLGNAINAYTALSKLNTITSDKIINEATATTQINKALTIVNERELRDSHNVMSTRENIDKAAAGTGLRLTNNTSVATAGMFPSISAPSLISYSNVEPVMYNGPTWETETGTKLPLPIAFQVASKYHTVLPFHKQHSTLSAGLIPSTPVSNAPVSYAPVSNAPVSNASVSNAPVSNAPASNAPVSNALAPASNAPALASNAPATNANINNAATAAATSAETTINYVFAETSALERETKMMVSNIQKIEEIIIKKSNNIIRLANAAESIKDELDDMILGIGGATPTIIAIQRATNKANQDIKRLAQNIQLDIDEIRKSKSPIPQIVINANKAVEKAESNSAKTHKASQAVAVAMSTTHSIRSDMARLTVEKAIATYELFFDKISPNAKLINQIAENIEHYIYDAVEVIKGIQQILDDLKIITTRIKDAKLEGPTNVLTKTYNNYNILEHV